MVNPFQPGRLSIGTAALGGLYAEVTVADAMATLERAVARGITHFDTAPHYGRGLAESRLGDFLRTADGAGKLTVSTKVGRYVRDLDQRDAGDIFLGAPPGESVFDFSRKAVAEQLDQSRQRLGREFIDVVLVHDPDEHLDEALVAIDELTSQREAGRVGALGVGTNTASVVSHLVDRVDLDVVVLAGRITLLESSGESAAKRCRDLGITLLAAGVFQSGILAGGVDAPFDYGPAPESVRTRVIELERVCSAHGVSLQQIAINHPRRFTGVTSTLVGVRSADEVDQAVDAISLDLPDVLWEDIDLLRARFGQRSEPQTKGQGEQE